MNRTRPPSSSTSSHENNLLVINMRLLLVRRAAQNLDEGENLGDLNKEIGKIFLIDLKNRLYNCELVIIRPL